MSPFVTGDQPSASGKANRHKPTIYWYWELLLALIQRNLKIRYRGSVLGIYWSLLNPLIMTGLYTAVFGATFAKYYDNSIINYVLAAFTGLIVINFFTGSTFTALVSVVDNGAMVNKIRLPLFIFPLSNVGANVFQLLMGSFPLLVIATLILSPSIINVIALLLPLLALVAVCTGVGLLMSALYVFFRDLNHFYELFNYVLLISSPIFYPSAIVPTEVKKFLLLNPLLPIIESIRQIALSGDLPQISLIIHAAISSLIVLTLGVLTFTIWQSKFMDLL